MLQFDSSLTDLDLDSMSQECKESKTCTGIMSQRFQSGIVWRFVGVVHFSDELHTHFIESI